MVLRLRRWMWFCCWIASFTAFRFILLMCRDINRILWKKLLLLRINIARIDSSEVIRSASCPVILKLVALFCLPWVPEIIFFREIEREIRGGATSPRREAQRSKKYFAPPPRISLSLNLAKKITSGTQGIFCFVTGWNSGSHISQWKQMSRVNVGV